MTGVMRWMASLRGRTRLLRAGLALVIILSLGLGVVKAVIPLGAFGGALLALIVAALPELNGAIKALIDRNQARQKQREDLAVEGGAIEGHRHDLLTMIRKRYVEPGLAPPLGKTLRLELRLVERRTAVDAPRGNLPAPAGGADVPLPAGKPILSVFRDALNQLLILGQPGGGKTRLLLELADSLLTEAERTPTAPIPVIFDLASWNDTVASMEAWMVAELHLNYGVADWLAQRWLDQDRLIPLLDGLDEVGDADLTSCVAAINKFHDDHGQLPMVVCSRVAEYEGLKTRLRLRSAVVVQPLAKPDIMRCLRGQPFASIRAVLKKDEQLLDLLTTPLFLTIVMVAYQGKGAAAMPARATQEELRRSLLAGYVQNRLSLAPQANEPQYPADQATRWLGWLARELQAPDLSVLYVDWMQPRWLPDRGQRRLVSVGPAVAVGVAVGLLAGIANSLVFGLVVAAMFALVAGVVAGLAAYEPDIAPTDELRWSWPRLGQNLPSWLLFGPVFGLFAGLSVGLIAELRGGLIALLTLVTSGLIAGLCLGLFFAAVGGLETPPYVEPKGPGQGIRSSQRNALVGGAVLAVLSALFAGVGGGLIVGLMDLPGELFVWLTIGLLVVGLAFGLVAGLFGLDPGIRVGVRGPRWRTGLIVGLGVALVLGQVGGLMAGHPGWLGAVLTAQLGGRPPPGLVAGLLLAPLVGVGTGIVHGLLRGGGSYLRHVVLLRQLVRNDSIAPSYVDFLAYAGRINLLVRRGGGYQFLHRYLLEFFAGPPSPSAPAAADAAA